uniref:calpain-5-like n=1 Tax=Ciona intestinalis TaxID=7719 RepID=UPI000180C6ED|nr:calpain-5-like [Ciona intestinalis]|eukprot:XP_002124635.1 calpain-5-like [Ciona intestinalis]
MDFYQSQVDYYMEQKFADIRKHCLSSGEYFEDTEFPPGDDALFLKEKSIPELKWRRPNMLCNEPHLIVGGTSSMDLTTGEFGSPAFVAACSVLANHEDFWKRVVPDAMTQEWNPMKPMTYTGVFKFRFWRFGRWTEVVVDDRLPVLDDQLFGIRSTEKNEFWSALLEKAYAKLVGCYEALHNMDSGEILQDLTGGIIEPINLRETVTDSQSKDDLFEDICDSRMSGRALLTCWIDKEAETKGELGLVSGNVYAVNAVREIKLGTGLLSFFK